MQGAEDEPLLAKLARGDASAAVRQAATERLTDLALLDEVNQRDEAATVKEAASLRIMSLLAGLCDDAPPLDTRVRLVRLTNNAKALAFIARRSPDAMCREAAVARLEDSHVLYELAINGSDESLRVCAAQRLTDLPLLKRLSREGRDKRVLRLARDQARTLQQQAQEHAAQQAQAEHLLESIEQHARRTPDGLYGARLEQLEQQWQQCRDQADDSLRQQVEQALIRCQQQHQAQQEALQRQARAEDAAAERKAAAQTLYQLLSTARTETWDQQLGDLRAALATQQRRWQSADEQSPAEAHARSAFNDLVQAFERMLSLAGDVARLQEDQDALRELAAQWPREYTMPSALAAACETPSHRDVEEHHAAGKKAPKSRPATPHRGLLVALKRELRQGNLRHANRLWHKAEAVIEEHDDAVLASELKKLQERRAELQDWHAFAAEPKKVALCEAMESLNEASMDAPQLATAIQALHDEWRELMSSDQDKDQALWERFKSASDIAYQPCQAHFAEQDVIKASNLQRRRELCDQLDAFLRRQDWQQVDWPAFWQIRQQAPRDWKALQPVRFTDNRDLQKRFSALLSSMDEHLDGAIEQAGEARQQLLDEAKRLQSLDDLQEAARLAQALQKRWREAPWLPPAKHRALQKTFRKVMDNIFAARNQAAEASREHRQQHNKAIEQHLLALEGELGKPLAAQDDALLREHSDALQQYQGDMPRGLHHRYQACRQAQSRRREQQALLHKWQALESQLARLPVGAESNDSACEMAVALEAIAGMPSPEGEQSRRLAWQLERLPAAMKRQQYDPLEEAGKVLTDYPDALLCDQTLDRARSAIATLQPGLHT
ncbi:MAG: DUF349 domain-containing protein [Alcanivorax sp.]|nr:DUF349 domain-containing protein [Alcanivorax sp.]